MDSITDDCCRWQFFYRWKIACVYLHDRVVVGDVATDDCQHYRRCGHNRYCFLSTIAYCEFVMWFLCHCHMIWSYINFHYQYYITDVTKITSFLIIVSCCLLQKDDDLEKLWSPKFGLWSFRMESNNNVLEGSAIILLLTSAVIAWLSECGDSSLNSVIFWSQCKPKRSYRLIKFSKLRPYCKCLFIWEWVRRYLALLLFI